MESVAPADLFAIPAPVPVGPPTRHGGAAGGRATSQDEWPERIEVGVTVG